jgi:lysophospholipase L1-like esterase
VVSDIEQTAKDLNLPTIDVYAAFRNNSGYLLDGVHPSADGSEVIASAVYDAITSSDQANLIDNYFS